MVALIGQHSTPSSTQHTSPNAAHTVIADEQNFEQTVIITSTSVPVLVDFWADWCAPCKQLMPVLAKLAQEYGGRFKLAKVDTEANPRLAAACGIRSLPTVMLFKNGQVVDGFVGVQSESAIRALLDKHLGMMPETDDPPPADAQVPLSPAERISILSDALSQDRDNLQLRGELALLQAQSGDLTAAEKNLNAVAKDKQADPALSAAQAFVRLAQQARLAPALADLQALSSQSAALTSEQQCQLGLQLAVCGEYEAALERLLKLVAKDRKYGDDAGRKTMLDIFTVLSTDPGLAVLLKTYRSRLYSTLN